LDGSSYSGEYLNGKKHGIGTNIWSDGSKYEGYWYNNGISGYVKNNILIVREFIILVMVNIILDNGKIIQ
jgi:hypothetical protein